MRPREIALSFCRETERLNYCFHARHVFFDKRKFNRKKKKKKNMNDQRIKKEGGGREREKKRKERTESAVLAL